MEKVRGQRRRLDRAVLTKWETLIGMRNLNIISDLNSMLVIGISLFIAASWLSSEAAATEFLSSVVEGPMETVERLVIISRWIQLVLLYQQIRHLILYCFLYSVR